MAITVVYDANVLYPSALRDLLIRLAQAGSVQARWTHRILDETFASLARNRPDLDPSRLQRTRELMVPAVRDCLVTGYEPLIEAVDLPDPDDRHVLAAAIKARAHIVVTWNVKDFPAECTVAWDVEAKDPDAFVLDQIHLDRSAVYAASQRMADACTDPPRTVNDVLSRLEGDGLVQAMAALQAL